MSALWTGMMSNEVKRGFIDQEQGVHGLAQSCHEESGITFLRSAESAAGSQNIFVTILAVNTACR
jgi:hypothetical protein